MGAGDQKDQLMIRSLEFSVLPHSPEKREGLEMELMIYDACIMELMIYDACMWKVQGLGSFHIWGEWYTPTPPQVQKLLHSGRVQSSPHVPYYLYPL